MVTIYAPFFFFFFLNLCDFNTRLRRSLFGNLYRLLSPR